MHFHPINYEKYNPEKDLESNEFMSTLVVLHVYCAEHGSADVEVDSKHNFAYREKEFLPQIMEDWHENSCDTANLAKRTECAKKVNEIISGYYHMLKEWDRATSPSQKDDTSTYIKPLALPHGALRSFIGVALRQKGHEPEAEEIHKIWEKKNVTNECLGFAVLTITMMHGAGQPSGRFTYKLIDDHDQILFETEQKLSSSTLDQIAQK